MKYLRSFRLFENKSPLLNLKNNIDEDLINLIESFNPKNILEISCGNGADAIELSKRGYSVTATDLNQEYVDYVNDYLNCIQHDTRNRFPFDDNSFDVVYSRLGLHYFDKEDLYRIFNDISRITSGYLIFTVKLVNDIQTGKVIFDESDWEEITSKNFEIVSSKIREGFLYENQSKWLEIVAKKL